MKPECSVDGCSTLRYKREWCNPHYLRWRRYGSPTAPLRKQRTPADGLCTVTDCQALWLSRGYCKRHYERFVKYGDPLGSAPRVMGCLIDGCEGEHKGRGYCSAHLRRLRLYGDPTFIPPRKGVEGCLIDGCEGEHYSLGLCRSHYWIQSKYGDPLAVPTRGAKVHRPQADRVCPTCGRTFSPGTSPKRVYCRAKCRPNRRRGGGNRYALRRVAARVGWTCHLCGEECHPDLYHPDPLSPTIDHLVPVALGGTDEAENLAIAHFRCNVRRGVRPL